MQKDPGVHSGISQRGRVILDHCVTVGIKNESTHITHTVSGLKLELVPTMLPSQLMENHTMWSALLNTSQALLCL